MLYPQSVEAASHAPLRVQLLLTFLNFRQTERTGYPCARSVPLALTPSLCISGALPVSVRHHRQYLPCPERTDKEAQPAGRQSGILQ